jgi:hypothetical protein
VVALLLGLMACGERVTRSDKDRKSVWKFGHAGRYDVAQSMKSKGQNNMRCEEYFHLHVLGLLRRWKRQITSLHF